MRDLLRIQDMPVAFTQGNLMSSVMGCTERARHGSTVRTFDNWRHSEQNNARAPCLTNSAKVLLMARFVGLARNQPGLVGLWHRRCTAAEGSKIMANAAQPKNHTAAVTGAGSGLGRDIALGLAAKNFRVFGTALSPREIDDLKNASD